VKIHSQTTCLRIAVNNRVENTVKSNYDKSGAEDIAPVPDEGMTNLDNSQQKELGAYIGRLLRDSFGKGPEGTFVSIGGHFVTVYLRNFMSPTEQILMEQRQEAMVVSTRATLMEKLIPEIKTGILFITGIELQELYYDWGLHNRSGMMVGISVEPFAAPPVNETYVGKAQVHREVDDISQQAQKVPDETYSCELNRRTLIVIRNGILVAIEKELIRLGYEIALKYAKGNLEKRYLHNSNHFESSLNKKVIDIFLDWDFVRDKSVIAFVLNE
jgi:uncharacterized protein YbcI